MRYEGSVYRPPSEAGSLIVQATIGCANNSCTFCSMYKDKSFRMRSEVDIISDLCFARQRYKKVSRIFLADGDALALPMKLLIKILDAIARLYPECERVSVYGTPQDVLRKTEQELKTLYDLGLQIVYLGAESGSDVVLKNIKKGCCRYEIIEAIKKIERSGMKASVTFISGLGGKSLSEDHAVMTGSLISESEPSYVGLLTLLLEPSAPMYMDVKEGKFEMLTAMEVAEETFIMLENIEVNNNCIFRSNHASNYVSLKGTLPADKNRMIAELRDAVAMGAFKDEGFRLL